MYILHRMNRNTKTIRIFLKQLKREQKNITPTNFLHVLEIVKNMECYERYNWKIKNKIDKSSM